jgi:vesicle coat complex subunit
MRQYAALDLIVTAMKKERQLRDAVDAQIASAQTLDTLDEWNKIKNAWRSTDQKKKIADNIRRVEAAIKSSEEAAKLEATKQAKLDELNKKLATSTDPAEKQAIASQISALMGNVATQTGLPKGSLYIGIGVAVVVGIWITLRAIRK